jgi:hypothetical protein
MKDSETLDRQKERDELEKILATLVIDAQWREGFFPEDKIQIAKSAIRAYEKRKIETLRDRDWGDFDFPVVASATYKLALQDCMKSLGIE